MNINKLYKYINLLLRILIGLLALYFIYTRVNESFLDNLNKVEIIEIDYVLVVLAVILLFFNWGIEAFKWRYAIRNTEEVSVLKAFKFTITGITIGLLTPNRIGEIPARALLLNKSLFKELTLKTVVSSFSQVLITMLLGVVGFILTIQKNTIVIHPTLWIVFLTSGVIILFMIYFKTQTLVRLLSNVKYIRDKEIFKALSEFSERELLYILLLSFFRYFVFAFQYYLVLAAFKIELSGIYEIFLIPVCFMFASFIPTILISEIGVRGSVALFVFGTISNLDIQIIIASILLWLINVAFPSLLGLFNLKELKVLKEN